MPKALPDFLQAQRWFGGKARTIQSVEVLDVIPLAVDSAAFIAFVLLAYRDHASETYTLPLQLATGDGASQDQTPRLALELEGGSRRAILLDALWQGPFCSRLLRMIAGGETMAGERSRIVARPSRALGRIWTSAEGDLDAAVLRGEQSNTSLAYGDRLILKFFRKLEPGTNPDLEIGLFLTEKTSYSHIARTAGSLVVEIEGAAPASLGILQEFIPNRGDAWKFTLAYLAPFFERVSTADPGNAEAMRPPGSILHALDSTPPAEVRRWIGSYFDDVCLLARRTAELHAALASDSSDPGFAPEPFTASDRSALIQGMASLLDHVFTTLRVRLPGLAAGPRADAEKALRSESALRLRFESLAPAALDFKRVRIHGDYHLGQVLRTANDFAIIDFEGEPARSIAERRAKRSPLQDVAGIVRSFHYAASAGQLQFAPERESPEVNRHALDLFARLWYEWVSTVFLRDYFKASDAAVYLPRERREARLLLESFLLEKAIYELGYELNNRPDWVRLPLRGILDLIGES